MPGLLQTPSGSLYSYKLAYAFLAELIGTLVFSLYGSATTLSGTTNSSLNNAIGNGWTLSVIIYVTANISGAHLNPAVTLATMLTGHCALLKGVLYLAFQIGGAVLGSLLLAALLHPEVTVGDSALPSGCFGKTGVTSAQLFGWEFIGTFILVMTVYAVAIGEPSFGIAAPFAVGLSLLVSVQAAGKFTGGALNPARAIGPSVVFVCNWNTTWVYVLGEIAGGLVAGIASLPLYGKGPDFFRFFSRRGTKGFEDNLTSTQDIRTVLETPTGSVTGHV